jgi:uncharacterized protein YyaL (SSP411 family)
MIDSGKHHREPNALIHSTSPYLLQHAYNPVQWQTWGEHACQLAVEQNKPIVLSIGYAACHWCHVMERESFENEEVAAFMNRHFICIKVDREEHPDVDHFYMNGCQILTGSGGWPLNMFLTPDLKPFSGGTYFPPQPKYGKPSWMDALAFVHDVWKNRHADVMLQAEQLTTQISTGDKRMLQLQMPVGNPGGPNMDMVIQRLQESYDLMHGGFGGAPKFPAAMTLLFMLRLARLTGNAAMSNQVKLSLDHMMQGGIYDHVGGAFSRYTVDAAWQIPHFEKMLYDNALLIGLYAEAYSCYQEPEYGRIVEECMSFLTREMQSEEGGFYAAYDADSEGVEGKFYTWSRQEVEALLGADASWFCTLFDIREQGNWEHTNILHRNHPNQVADIAAQDIQCCLQVLFTEREKRVKPQLDDKIIVSWNALLVEGFIQAYRATGRKDWLQLAMNTVDVLLKTCMVEGTLMHVRCKGQTSIPALLDDYAAMIQALLSLFGETGDRRYLEQAEQFTKDTEAYYRDTQSPMFFMGRVDNRIPRRSIELFDHAQPSGNALMAMNYNRLWLYTGETNYEAAFHQMAGAIQTSLEKFPSSFGCWLQAILPLHYPVAEVVVAGPDATNMLIEVNKCFHPLKISLAVCDKSLQNYPISTDRFDENVTRIFLCRDHVCQQPVSTVSEYKSLLEAF